MASKNSDLLWLRDVQERARELQAEETQAVEKIRAGLIDMAVIFMDVVGSTAFKQKYADSPEVWILRVHQFSELLAKAVRAAGGSVVKYIGDEVMAVFKNVNDAQNLVGRIPEIEKTLCDGTGHETRIKVAADFGPVYPLNFEGHEEEDPQGPAVDRCARIAKYGQAGEVLASADFADRSDALKWYPLGTADLKGLGKQMICQLKRETVDLSEVVEVRKDDYDKLQEANEQLEMEVRKLTAKNKHLAEQLQAADQQPDPADLAEAEDEDGAEAQWAPIEADLKKLRTLIERAPVPAREYARFLFLSNTAAGGDTYDAWNGKKFDGSIENKLVWEADGLYMLDSTHPLNAKVIGLMSAIQESLRYYVDDFGPDPDDLYLWELSDPQFWAERIGIDVSGF